MSMVFHYGQFGAWKKVDHRPEPEEVGQAVGQLYAEIAKMFVKPFVVKELNVFVKPRDNGGVCDPIDNGHWAIGLKAGVLHLEGDGEPVRLVEGVEPKPL